MSDDSWKLRGPHVVCRALEASLRAEIRELKKRIRVARGKFFQDDDHAVSRLLDLRTKLSRGAR